MKKFLTITVVAAALVIGCNSQTTSEQPSEKIDNTDQLAMVNNVVGEPIHLTKQQFLDEIMDYESNPTEWIYKGEQPALIDFYADWCRPCKITSPIIDELAQEYAGKIKVYKVDVDTEKELAAVFGIQSIPTFLYVPQTDKPVMSSGIAQTPAETKAMFKQQIEEILLNNQN